MPGNFTFYTHQCNGQIAHFDENERRHAIVSLRYQSGDSIHFTDGLGTLFEGILEEVSKTAFTAKIVHAKTTSVRSQLLMVCGIIKSGDRLEWMVEKCTELGVSGIYLVPTTNSERVKINLDRMQRTAIAALKQSHGAWLPEIRQISWKEVLDLKGEKWIAAIAENAQPISNLTAPEVCLIGPEGDFTQTEIQEAIHAGYKPVTLGKTVLRTETAVIALAASIQLRTVSG